MQCNIVNAHYIFKPHKTNSATLQLSDEDKTD